MKIIGFLLIVAAAAPGSPIYTVANLGGMGGSSATGYAIDSSGAVAGWGLTASGSEQAFVSTANGLQALPSGGFETYAYGINDSGTVVGTTYVGGQAHGTIWAGSTTTDLGANSYALAINGAGEVVGGNGEAFVVENGNIQALAPTAGANWSAAYGINAAGTVVGDERLANGTFQGMTWNTDGSSNLLGTFGGSSSQATGINSSGDVVGFASLASGYQNAFSAVDGMMVNLGTLGGGSSYAYGVNDSGEVVGYSWLAGGGQSAFLYDDGTMLDLNSLIPSNSGWDLLQAYAINASGQITGMGMYDGQLSAFLLTDPPAAGSLAAIPEPSSFPVIGAALVLFAGFRLRRLWA